MTVYPTRYGDVASFAFLAFAFWRSLPHGSEATAALTRSYNRLQQAWHALDFSIIRAQGYRPNRSSLRGSSCSGSHALNP